MQWYHKSTITWWLNNSEKVVSLLLAGKFMAKALADLMSGKVLLPDSQVSLGCRLYYHKIERKGKLIGALFCLFTYSFMYVCMYSGRLSLYNHGWPGTHRHIPAFVSWIPGLKVRLSHLATLYLVLKKLIPILRVPVSGPNKTPKVHTSRWWDFMQELRSDTNI